ncbi:pyridoxal-phosphate dependent enzyme [bacterium]|nr:pyridoxal-phosphate dependent enzyme [bacterium]
MSEGNRVDQLLEAIHLARARVYQIGNATPLEPMVIEGVNQSIWVKREDLGPIKAYKWRGAFNAMACLTPAQLKGGVVAASAGNHAQGIALAARKLGTKAFIYMPKPTPLVKRKAVMAHGGDSVSIELTGDSFAEAQTAALEHAAQTGATFIPPYDSIDVMAGQGTLADEIFTSGEGPFDRVYVAVGGGGMASAVAALLKSSWPKVKVIGVEGVDQASMKAAIEMGKPVPLDYVDVFCDGTHKVQLNCTVEEFDFSGHARREELLEFAVKARPKKLLLVHGDPDAASWFEKKLAEALPETEVIIPQPKAKITF